MQNPYQNNFNADRFAQKEEVIKVNGENGARAYNMAANSSALLLDTSNPLVWLVQTDGAGYKTVSPYSIAPYQPSPEPDLRTLEERIQKIEEVLTYESNNAKPTVSSGEPATSEYKTDVSDSTNGKESKKRRG